MTARVNYLNNRDLLSEIHKSKTSFSSFINDEYHQYDIILQDINDINDETLEEARKNRAKRLSQQDYEYRKNVLKEKVKAINKEIKFRIFSFLVDLYRLKLVKF